MKPAHLIVILAVLAAGSARAQLLAPPQAPQLLAERPAPLASLPSYSGFRAGAKGLAPADPLAPDLYRADLKLFADFAFNRYLRVETTFVNPDYVEGMHYLGPGPRLAQGIALGVHPADSLHRAVGGGDLDVAARLTLPVDNRLDAFGKLGITASERTRSNITTREVGAAASVGAAYKLDNGQTLSAEAPLGAMARKALTGAYGARLKLGF